jgi:thioredoxin:protein disulfide reductase
MKTLLSIFAFLICVLFSSPAQSADSAVAIQAKASSESLKAGESGAIAVELSIAPRYHINADKPLQTYLKPTRIEFTPIPDVVIGTPVFPKAEVKKLPVSDTPMAVYEGNISIVTEIRPAATFHRKQIVVQGRVQSQACDNYSCLPPIWQSFRLTLPVVQSNALSADRSPVPASQPQAVDTPSGNRVAEQPGRSSGDDLGKHGIFITFILVFLGGLALNLTPCVYPMIPITITYFGGQAKGKRENLIAHSILYVVGMAITYSILGVVAAMTGGFLGSILQLKPVLAAIAFVMVLLALSMFDVYELRMPAFLNRLAGSSQSGFIGTLLMGLTVGIVAAPCIGPFVLGLLTYVGNRGSVLLGFLLFFTFALGLGVPFLLLGIFSGSLHQLPRSGAWMVWVRKAFGFILLAMAVYFARNLLPGSLTYLLTLALLLLLAGIYLAWIDPVPDSGRIFVFVRNIVGILFFIAALYAVATGVQSELEKMGSSAAKNVAAGSIQWTAYSQEKLDQALLDKKPMFLDFYADWCMPCKELDEKTFSDPDVVRRSSRFVMFKIDLTTSNDVQANALKKHYLVRGVPTLVFLSPDGREIQELRGTGFESKDAFLNKLDRALQSVADSESVNRLQKNLSAP